MAAGTKQETTPLSQGSYRETPYQDSSWEIIGEDIRHEHFVPMDVEVFSYEEASVDAMFADFGGRSKAGDGGKRWHLPEHLAYQSEEEKSKKNAQEEQLSFTPAQLEEIKSAAREEGRRLAVEEIAMRQQEKLSQIERHLAETLNDLTKQLREHQERLERDCVDLAIKIARKIIDGAVEINPEYIIPIVREALQLAGGAAIQKVRISPQDMEFIELVGISRHLKEYDGSWQFEADSTIRAGCVIETSAGEIDYQLDQAWERVQDNILKVVR